MRAGVKRLAAGLAGPAAGVLPGTVPRAGRLRAGCLRGTRYHRCAVGAALLRRRLVRGGQTPPGRRCHGAVSAAPPADGAGALGITVRSAWTGGRWRFRCPAAARRCGSASTGTCPTPPGRSARPSCCSTRGRLWLEVTAEVPVAGYPAGQEPDPGRVAGVDLGIIHPYAVAGPGAQGLLVSGRPDHTFRVCPRPGVTRAAALITAAPAGPLAGTGPPRPPPPGASGESLASPRGPRKHPTNLRRGALG